MSAIATVPVNPTLSQRFVAMDQSQRLKLALGVVLGDSRLPIQLMIHPVLRIARDRRGRLLRMEDGDSARGTG